MCVLKFLPDTNGEYRSAWQDIIPCGNFFFYTQSCFKTNWKDDRTKRKVLNKFSKTTRFSLVIHLCSLKGEIDAASITALLCANPSHPTLCQCKVPCIVEAHTISMQANVTSVLLYYKIQTNKYSQSLSPKFCL